MSSDQMEGPGRVLVALHDELLNGATLSVLRAVPLLEEEGWQFVFWVPQPGPAADWLHERGSRVLGEARPIVSGFEALREPPGAWRRLSATPGYLWRFSKAVRLVAPQLVHSNSLYSYAEALTARALGVPTLLHVHDMAPESRKLAVARWVCRTGVDLTVAASEACAASYAANGWVPEVVHEAAPIPTKAAPIRESPRPFVVGTVGVVSKRKGTDIFVEAARQVLTQDQGIEFRLVGEPTDPLDRDWGAGVLRAAAAAGIQHSPWVEVLDELRGWDAFVLPSRKDPFPIVMLEAMASGLPVIGTAVDGIPEQLTPESGILIEPGSPEALAAAIRHVSALPSEARRAMGHAARQRVSSHFDLARQARGLDDMYRRLAPPGPMPPARQTDRNPVS